MNDDPMNGRDRESQARRTAAARRGLVAAGTVGALGAALTIGVTQTIASNDSGTEDQSTVPQQDAPQDTQQDAQRAHQPAVHERDDEEGDEGSDDQQLQQVPNPQPPQNGGQLAVPGNGGAPQGQSSGS
jgi:hypothetical protein